MLIFLIELNLIFMLTKASLSDSELILDFRLVKKLLINLIYYKTTSFAGNINLLRKKI